MVSTPHFQRIGSRRNFLLQAGGGFGAVALTHLLAAERAHGQEPEHKVAVRSPLAPKAPHHRPRAKSIIWLFMEGGPSHIDFFDPKPLVNELAGQSLPASFKQVILPGGQEEAPILRSPRTWKRYGKSEMWVSDWLPHVGGIVDDISLVRSCICDGLNHAGSVCQMNTGSLLSGRPSLGSWVSYGLGTENESLPAFVVLLDKPGRVAGGARNWGTGFMSATHQGTEIKNGDEPIANLSSPAGVDGERQRRKLEFLQKLNRRHLVGRGEHSELEARIASYELAFRMQAEAPEAADLASESQETHELYGFNDKKTLDMGRACLLARRLVERGVRFVQVYCGTGSKWDAHSDIENRHASLARASDKPVAGLIKDLKRRGLLEETLVVWGGEFGRTPQSENGDGRDHNPYGFSTWFAGGGVKRGFTLGATDELGLHAIEGRTHVYDLHATMLHLLGIDHLGLVYDDQGREELPTINQGKVVTELIA